MGEIADMVLDGILCEGCGEFIGEGDGFPRKCAACAPDATPEPTSRKRKSAGGRCPNCNRHFSTHDAYLQHWRAKHQPRVEPTDEIEF